MTLEQSLTALQNEIDGLIQNNLIGNKGVDAEQLSKLASIANLLEKSVDIPPALNNPLGQTKAFVDHRLALEVEATKLVDLQAVSTTGAVELIPTPGPGRRLVITYIKAQNTTNIPTLAIFLSPTQFLDFIQTVEQGTGELDDLRQANWIRLPEDEAFQVNQTAANLHFYLVRYFIQDVVTGLVA